MFCLSCNTFQYKRKRRGLKQAVTKLVNGGKGKRKLVQATLVHHVWNFMFIQQTQGQLWRSRQFLRDKFSRKRDILASSRSGSNPG